MSDTHTRLPDGQTALVVAAHPPVEEPAEAAMTEAAELLDRTARAAIAQMTLGLSPSTVVEAMVDWAAHMATSPGRRLWLRWKAARKAVRLGDYLGRVVAGGGQAEPCIEPLPQDRRFSDPAWQSWPFNLYQQNFLLCQQWLHNATTGLRGVSAPHERIVSFMARQMLDICAPSNFMLTNPLVLQRTIDEAGANLVRGATNLLEDVARASGTLPRHAGNPAVGQTVAITPGRVVYRNHLIELIQYAPATSEVAAEPVLIVPAWIMKYYILDLSAGNSLVRFMVERGFSVFMVSWRNPDTADRDLSMDDYLNQGVMAAIDAVCAITGSPALHATGYCLGGTLLSIAAAAMAQKGDNRLRSLSLFAAQQDFTEAGELTLFISEAQVSLLEDMMWSQGYLEARQMAGAFQILRSNDLVWSYVIEDYLMGERQISSDLMAWNADATRMPARMHSQYLRHLFLDNDLSEGRYQVGGSTVAIGDIQVPIFAVGTMTDHVAPWQSVYKIHLLTDAEVTFVLTSGGHNAGIVSEPGHHGRSFHQHMRVRDERYRGPEEWMAQASKQAGSWWLVWADWLSARSDGMGPPPAMGKPDAGYPVLDAAPGTYVLQT